MAEKVKTTTAVKPTAKPKSAAKPAVKPTAKPVTKKTASKAAVVKTSTKETEKKPVKTERKLIRRYHISLDKNDGKWKVFLAGSPKVIKKFNTQLDAYNFAMNLSDDNDRGVVVHSKKGTTRKMGW